MGNSRMRVHTDQSTSPRPHRPASGGARDFRHGVRQSVAFLSVHSRSAALPTHTHTHPFNGPLSGTTRVSRYQKRKTNLDFTEARDSEWQWHQLGHMQVCTSLQTDNHANTSLLSFLQAGCPSCRPTNSVKALKASATMNVNTSKIAYQCVLKCKCSMCRKLV